MESYMLPASGVARGVDRGLVEGGECPSFPRTRPGWVGSPAEPNLSLADTGGAGMLGSSALYLAASSIATSINRGHRQQHLRARDGREHRGSNGNVAGRNREANINTNNYATSPSPELLFSSGRITASRYHEMLKEFDGDRGGLSGSAQPAMVSSTALADTSLVDAVVPDAMSLPH